MRRAISERGVTLIELMVGIAIVALVLGLGVPSYAEWIQNSRIRNAAESILNGLRLARSEAVTRNVPVQFKLADSGPGWTVGCVTVTATCLATIQERAAGEGSSAAVTVAAADGKTFQFNSLGQMAAPVPAGGAVSTAINVDIDPSVLSAAKSRDLRVTVDVGGNVRMCDPNVTSPDARAC
jgi:type IV fimbrial biogenesis protein FimT